MKNENYAGYLFPTILISVFLLLLVFVHTAVAADVTDSLSASSTSSNSSPPAQTNTTSTVSTTPSVSLGASTTSTPIDVSLPNPLLPQISSITSTSSGTSAVITWQTSNQVSSGAVFYGTSTNYTATSTSDLALDHSVTLDGLASDTLYHFEIQAATGNGSATSPDQTFTTSVEQPTASGTPPTISMITVVPSYSLATISWTTDEPSTSTVWYGISVMNASSTGDAQLAQLPTENHVVTINNLSPGTIYRYEVISTNASGVTTTSSELAFATPSM